MDALFTALAGLVDAVAFVVWTIGVIAIALFVLLVIGAGTQR